MADPSDYRANLNTEINSWLGRWRRGQKAWSAAHHITLFGAAILSLAVGFIVQMDAPLLRQLPNANLSTILAFVAAALSGVAAAGGFERKWLANRLSRGRLDDLRIDFMDPDVDLKDARAKLKDILRMHDQEILGSSGRTDQSGTK